MTVIRSSKISITAGANDRIWRDLDKLVRDSGKDVEILGSRISSRPVSFPDVDRLKNQRIVPLTWRNRWRLIRIAFSAAKKVNL